MGMFITPFIANFTSHLQSITCFCYQRIKRVDTVTERLTEDFDEEMEALQVQPYTTHTHTHLFKVFGFTVDLSSNEAGSISVGMA